MLRNMVRESMPTLLETCGLFLAGFIPTDAHACGMKILLKLGIAFGLSSVHEVCLLSSVVHCLHI